MTNHDPMPMARWDLRQAAGANVGVFVSAEFMASARAARETMAMPLTVEPLEPGAPIAREALSGLAAAVIEMRPGEPHSLQRLREIFANAGGVPVVAAIATADLAMVRTLVREGVADVVSLPLDAGELSQVVLDVVARHAGKQKVELCPVVTIVKANGGCGATTLATHLTGELAEFEWRGMVPALVDLDVQFGAASEFLGLEPKGSVLDLVKATDRLDDALIDSVACPLAGFSVVPAPNDIVPLDSLDVDTVMLASEHLRQHYGLVVLDVPSNWSDWSLSLVSGSDLVLMVVELSILSIRQAKRNLDLFESIGLSKSRVKVVLSKVEKKFFSSLRPQDVHGTLGCEVIGSLPFEPAALAAAQQAGVFVGQQARRNPYAKDVAKLAQAVHSAVRGSAG